MSGRERCGTERSPEKERERERERERNRNEFQREIESSEIQRAGEFESSRKFHSEGYQSSGVQQEFQSFREFQTDVEIEE
jgi:ribosomal protein S30